MWKAEGCHCDSQGKIVCIHNRFVNSLQYHDHVWFNMLLIIMFFEITVFDNADILWHPQFT